MKQMVQPFDLIFFLIALQHILEEIETLVELQMVFGPISKIGVYVICVRNHIV